MNSFEKRKQWLRVLSCAEPTALIAALNPVTEEVVELRKPETGLVLVKGRIGSTGSPFGLGEMTVTRCIVQIDQAMGVGYVKGRNGDHARAVAIADALLQGSRSEEIRTAVIEPLERDQFSRTAERQTDVETSRVQFLTMVRGD